ncbi:hypothetical protein DERP_001361 [Dermatophagoides pteronyssinus]|uniref:Uncharacterized protein n=1 Tax=Dermatophagoides pteronyssinus TaxID=6956 RepID=A0ABQ8JE84_DERPT|nr:hypothetical protein DERP_001361 [Dermatophagoides pteronyssinus]
MAMDLVGGHIPETILKKSPVNHFPLSSLYVKYLISQPLPSFGVNQSTGQLDFAMPGSIL